MWAWNFFMYSTNMFFRVAFVACLLALVSANPLENGFETRILGGRSARKGEFPHMVSIHYNSSLDVRCGGAILSDMWVLTAAHCIENNDHDNIVIRAGRYNIKSTELHEQIVPVRGVFIKEDYNFDLRLSDIVLFKLAHPLQFNGFVNSISLPVQGSEPTGTAILTGWGLTSNDGPYPDILHAVFAQLLDAKKCEKVMKQLHPSLKTIMHPSNVCTSAGPDRVSACNGDSGGPLIQGNKIVGVVAWGYVPCGSGSPTVYTKVSSFVDWINQKMKNN